MQHIKNSQWSKTIDTADASAGEYRWTLKWVVCQCWWTLHCWWTNVVALLMALSAHLKKRCIHSWQQENLRKVMKWWTKNQWPVVGAKVFRSERQNWQFSKQSEVKTKILTNCLSHCSFITGASWPFVPKLVHIALNTFLGNQNKFHSVSICPAAIVHVSPFPLVFMFLVAQYVRHYEAN